MIRVAFLGVVAVTGLPGWAWTAEDAYFSIPLGALESIERMAMPDGSSSHRRGRVVATMLPRVVLEGEGEAYVSLGPDFRLNRWGAPTFSIDAMRLAARVPTGRELRGTLYLPKPDWTGMNKLPFIVASNRSDAKAKEGFQQAKQAHFERLLQDEGPGGAWFRHQIRTAATDRKTPTDPRWQNRQREGELSRTYELFSGGRALSENLQLDRMLRVGEKPEEESVDVDGITAITVQQIDWNNRIKGLKPKLDPLAALIPADQHVVFFPDFSAAAAVADEADRQGTLVLRLAEPRSVDDGAQKTYERQLGLSLSGLGRLLGSKLVKSVALAGSDPYYRIGTDVVVLFEGSNATVLEKLLRAQIALGAKAADGVRSEEGKAGALAYRGFRSPDRRVCSYLARIDDAVVVTNSTAALERLSEVRAGKLASIASLPEYVFFRDRYRLGDPAETALVFLSDATIRRWCGPRWRIADSRRTRAMAILTEIQAANAERLGAGKAQPGPVYTDLPVESLGELTMGRQGAQSAVYGGLEFMTPIVELPIAKVARAEAEAYGRWREAYQQNWRWVFDPIALRLSLKGDKLAADLTVMPLITGTAYRDFIQVSSGATIPPGAGDPHDALFHAVLALNTRSEMFQGYTGMLSAMRQGLTFGWVGSSAALYVDEDPFWAEAAKVPAERIDAFWRENYFRVPLGVRIAADDGLKLAAFLVSGRAFVEQSAPGMTQWLNHTHRDQPYVQIRSTPGQRGVLGGDASLFYAVLGDGLLLTPNEGLMKRAIDRQTTRQEAKETDRKFQANPWLGRNLSVQVRQEMLSVLAEAGRERYQTLMQRIAWNNLPVLNEWRRLFPDQDPVEIHERLWKLRLLCPGGGRYVWNPEWQTMESTVYGHPGEPKRGLTAPPALQEFRKASFGLTFEDQGLRAQAELRREK